MKNTTITFGTQILQIILSIGTSIIIARALGPEGKGIYALAILLPTLIMSFGNLGIGPASVFYIGKQKYSANEIFRNNIILSFLFSSLGITVGLVIILFFGHSLFRGVPNQYLLWALLLIPLQFFIDFINHILLGLQKIKKYNFINLLQSLAFLVLIIIFLPILNLRIIAVISAQIASIFVGSIVLFHLIKKEVGNFRWAFNKNYFKDSCRFGLKIYLSNMVSFWHQRIDFLLTNIFLGPIAVGIYSISVGIAQQLEIIHRSAATVLFPRVSSETDSKNLKEFTPFVCRSTLPITTAVAILLFFLGHWIIILFYSQKFLDAVRPFQILLIGAVSMSGWGILANDLHGRGKPELNIFTNLISLATNITLNVIWIPKYGIIGAAWATTISYTLAFLLTTAIYNKISGNKIKDVLFLKKSDLKFYKNLIKSHLKNKLSF